MLPPILNNFQLHFADYHIVRGGKFTRQPRATARSRRMRNDIIISLSSSKRAEATASRQTRANLFVATLSYLFDVPSLCHSHSHVEIAFRLRDMRCFRISECRGKRYQMVFRSRCETDFSTSRKTRTHIYTRRCRRDYRRRYTYHVQARSYRDHRRGEFKKQLAHAA